MHVRGWGKAKDFHIDKASPINYWAEKGLFLHIINRNGPEKIDAVEEGTFVLTETLCSGKGWATFRQALSNRPWSKCIFTLCSTTGV